jgi:hypothetical protein
MFFFFSSRIFLLNAPSGLSTMWSEASTQLCLAAKTYFILKSEQHS